LFVIGATVSVSTFMVQIVRYLGEKLLFTPENHQYRSTVFHFATSPVRCEAENCVAASQLFTSDRQHAACLIQPDVPTQCLTKHVRRVPALGASSGEVGIQCILVSRVHTVVDNHPSTLPWCKTA